MGKEPFLGGAAERTGEKGGGEGEALGPLLGSNSLLPGRVAAQSRADSSEREGKQIPAGPEPCRWFLQHRNGGRAGLGTVGAEIALLWSPSILQNVEDSRFPKCCSGISRGPEGWPMAGRQLC